MLDKEFQYFMEHQQELASKYDGKYIVIVGNRVVGVYATNEEAYEESLKNYKLGESFSYKNVLRMLLLIQLFFIHE